MKPKNLTFILLLFCATYLPAQSISEADKNLVDSLQTENVRVFIITEYCNGCTKVMGERNPTDQTFSCMYNDNYCMLWLDKDHPRIHTKTANRCYELLSINSEKSKVIEHIDQLFSRLITDTAENEHWIEPLNQGSENALPITGTIFYKILKLDGFQEYSVNFNEHLFIHSPGTENTDSIEDLLSKILTEFNRQTARLATEGAKIKTNWE